VLCSAHSQTICVIYGLRCVGRNAQYGSESQYSTLYTRNTCSLSSQIYFVKYDGGGGGGGIGVVVL
jgi:hypothetical protein